MADAFSSEIQRLLQQTNTPGVMYAGWENPVNQAGQKAGEGVYATPFDRQGGDNVAEQQLRAQVEEVVRKFGGNGQSFDEAVRQMIEILKGTGQSPADRSGGAPVITENNQAQYGGSLSAPTATSAPAVPAALSAEDALAYAAWRSAQEEDRKKKEEADRKEREDKELSALAVKLAPAIANVIQTQVAASLDQRLSALGLSGQVTTQSAQSAPTQNANAAFGNQGFGQPVASQTTQVPAGLSAQGELTGAAFRDLPGVQAPQYAQATIGAQGVMSGDATHSQSAADNFIKSADKALSAITDPFQRGRAAEGAREVYGSILAGHTPQIDDPFLQNIADQAGVQYTNMGFGGAF